MKEIKFRTIYKRNNDIVIKYYKLGRDSDDIVGVKEWISSGFEIISRDLFTGLKDKNGVDIYEGDIIKGTWSSYSEEQRPDLWNHMVVRFGQGYVDASDYEEYAVSILGFFLEDIKEKDEITNSILDYRELEVIGNIYESPELLKQNV